MHACASFIFLSCALTNTHGLLTGSALTNAHLHCMGDECAMFSSALTNVHDACIEC